MENLPVSTEPTEITLETEKKFLKFNWTIVADVVEVKKADENNEWIHFDGSRESLMFPNGAFMKGDKVKITFERMG